MSGVESRTLSVSDLDTTISEDEPRVRDVRIGDASWNVSEPLNTRKTVEKNRAELEQYGPIHATREMIEIGSKAKRCVEEYWLNKAQQATAAATQRVLPIPFAQQALTSTKKLFGSIFGSGNAVFGRMSVAMTDTMNKALSERGETQFGKIRETGTAGENCGVRSWKLFAK